ncbi:hypothetical protein L484_007287 [Morus notabilis]|uniref:Uncharacterized protein n=2 Tax=Morus notabilis TaxID=981085 RepID=W9QZA9_9ROSA|nr:hypothetical protein L484_007287 [Morus notabilis]
MSTNKLSPKTFYAAYLVVKFADRAYGLDFLPSEVSIEVGSFKSQRQVYLNPNEGRKNPLGHVHSPNRPVEALRSRLLQEGRGNVCDRKDGWMEIELGSFFNGGNDKEVNISLKEVKGQHLKGGLIVEGIELRPKY